MSARRRPRLLVPRLVRKLRAPRQPLLCTDCLAESTSAMFPIRRYWREENGNTHVEMIPPGRLAETYFAHPNDRYESCSGDYRRIRGEYMFGRRLMCEPHALSRLYEERRK